VPIGIGALTENGDHGLVSSGDMIARGAGRAIERPEKRMAATTEQALAAAAALRPCPLWVRLAGSVIRRLPVGRYVAVSWAGRISSAPFLRYCSAGDEKIAFSCDLRDTHSREVCFTGIYEPQETAVLKALLRPGDCFVDVGANWGYFSLLAAQRVGGCGRVVAVEADPRTFERLAANIALSKPRNCLAVHEAAVEAERIVNLRGYDEAWENFGLSRISAEMASGNTFQVRGRRLDAILDESEIGAVALVKIDVEGAEDLVLSGMSRGLGGRYRNVLIELHPAYLAERGQSVEDVMGTMERHGYRGVALDHTFEANRRACYQRQVSLGDFVRPLEHVFNDPWPHTLWTLDGAVFRSSGEN